MIKSKNNDEAAQSRNRLTARVALLLCLGVSIVWAAHGQGVAGDALTQVRRSAIAALSRGDWAEAASLYQSAMAKDSAAAWPHLGLADVYRMNGSWASAAEHYDQALRARPDDRDLRKLADLCRLATAEKRSGVVRAETLRALGQFGFSDRESELSRDLQVQPASAPDNTEIRIPIQIPFPRNQSSIDALPASAIRQLEEVIHILGAAGEYDSVTIEGHTCRCGSEQANREIGQKRAEAVRGFLLARRISAAQGIAAVSFGASQPVISGGAASLPPSICERDEHHSQNRRAVIVAHRNLRKPVLRIAPVEISFFSRRAGTRAFERMADGAALKAGDEIKLRIRAEQTHYVYAFHRGSTGNWSVLFPAAASESGSPLTNPVEPGKTYAIPREEAGFVLDGNPGSEETYVYCREGPDLTFEGLVKDIEKGIPVHLLPPLPEEIAPRVSTAARQSSTSEHVAQQAAGKSASVPVPPSPPPPAKAVEGELRVDNWRDLLKPAPRLPDRPAAYIRFKHLK